MCKSENLMKGKRRMKSKLLIAFITISILSGTLLTAGEKQNTAVTPESRDNWWTLRNQAVNERVKQGNVDLLMIGDSITHGDRKSVV